LTFFVTILEIIAKSRDEILTLIQSGSDFIIHENITELKLASTFSLLSFDPLVPSFFISIIILRDYLFFTHTKKGQSLGDTGATALANALRENKSITTFDLKSKYFLVFLFLSLVLLTNTKKSQQYWSHRGQCIGQCFA